MKRIIIHWTAGNSVPNCHDLECYHFLVDKNGKIYNGKFKPEANEVCRSSMYAQHTGGGNTGSIGVSLCGMLGFRNSKCVGNYPITKIQFESAMQLIAELTEKYGIEVTPNTVMTHYEFGKKNPNTSSSGKIDIIYLPPYPFVEANDVGKFIRTKIKWYLQRKK